jgi:2-polyprenyl-3-methyl-5-hydroxy-6-metoxy-1,4-benzoquinol methylase
MIASTPSGPSPEPPPFDTHEQDRASIQHRVRDQYERYPYPPVAPPGQQTLAAFALMDYVQHVFWPARRELRGLRVLDAGCGTGNVAVAIAHRYPEVQVVGIDLSDASLAAARGQAERLGVGDNLTLRRLAIEDVGALGERFDYVVASGVLHHLADPEAGLRALADVLTPTGGLGLMLYATYGRQGVYMVQDLLRRLGGAQTLPEQVALTRKLLDGWRPDHPFQPRAWSDLRWSGDAGLVDLLLHVQDRSYTVPKVQAFLAGADLRLEQFYDPVAYNPVTYVTDPDVARALAALPAAEQSAAAELLHGAMRKHTLFATRASYEPVRVQPEGLAVLALHPKRSPLFDWQRPEMRGKKHGKHVVVRQYAFDVPVRGVELNAWQARVVERCDGQPTAFEIFERPEIYTSIPGLTPEEKLSAYGAFMELMAAQGALLCC